MTPGEFLERLMRYCALTGGSVTSYGRTLSRNAQVGGVATSAHLFWLGADVVYDTVLPARGEDLAKRLGLRLIREEDPPHDHLQPEIWPAG